MTLPGPCLPCSLEGQGDGDGEVAACGITDGGDVLTRDAGGGERIERGHTVVELCRVAELGGAPVVQHEADGAEGLGDVGGELAVAGGRADGESAAVGVEEHLGCVRSLRQAPDARDSADGVLAVRHTLRFDGGLVPFVEQRAQQPDGEVRRRRHDLGPVGVQVVQHVLCPRHRRG